MKRFPFGVADLDSAVGGGVFKGNLVLLEGESGAGARQLLHTSAVMNSLYGTDPDLFALLYGNVHPQAEIPREVHYVSFTSGIDEIRDDLKHTMEEEMVEKGVRGIQFQTFANEYFKLGSPRSRTEGPENAAGNDAESLLREDEESILYTGKLEEQEEALGGSEGLVGMFGAEALIELFQRYVRKNLQGNLLIVDSLTDLILASKEEVNWSDVVAMVNLLKREAHSRNGVILAQLGKEALREEEVGALESASDGVLVFEWSSSGNGRVRTMYFKKYLSVLPAEEGLDRAFVGGIRDEGYYISMVEKVL